MRGATDTRKQDVFFVDISIHAPHAGCDALGHDWGAYVQTFQSTHPRGVRLFQEYTKIGVATISIHAPARGATAIVVFLLPTVTFQSTHPMRGATPVSSSPPVSSSDFNPRTPCGVRHAMMTYATFIALFQSTHPMRGATGAGSGISLNQKYFNPRTPCGVRLAAVSSDTGLCPFQSTHPLRGATCGFSVDRVRAPISIHAPLAGCDLPALYLLY